MLDCLEFAAAQRNGGATLRRNANHNGPIANLVKAGSENVHQGCRLAVGASNVNTRAFLTFREMSFACTFFKVRCCGHCNHSTRGDLNWGLTSLI